MNEMSALVYGDGTIDICDESSAESGSPRRTLNPRAGETTEQLLARYGWSGIPQARDMGFGHENEPVVEGTSAGPAAIWDVSPRYRIQLWNSWYQRWDSDAAGDIESLDEAKEAADAMSAVVTKQGRKSEEIRIVLATSGFVVDSVLEASPKATRQDYTWHEIDVESEMMPRDMADALAEARATAGVKRIVVVTYGADGAEAHGNTMSGIVFPATSRIGLEGGGDSDWADLDPTDGDLDAQISAAIDLWLNDTKAWEARN